MNRKRLAFLGAAMFAGFFGAANAAEADGWVQANGISLHYEMTGAGPATIVLLHEIGMNLHSFDEITPILAQHYRVIRYDLRGFGASEKPVGPFTYPAEMADLAGLLDALNVKGRVFLVGGAIGGAVALDFAATYKQRVAAVIAISPAAYPQPRPKAAAAAATIASAGAAAYVKGGARMTYPLVLRTDPARVARFFGIQLSADPASLAAANLLVAQTGFADILPRIDCPTLIVGTSLFTLHSPAALRALAAYIPHGAYAELPSGHFAAFESPAETSALIVGYLGQHGDRH